jgi:hypothetical protein
MVWTLALWETRFGRPKGRVVGVRVTSGSHKGCPYENAAPIRAGCRESGKMFPLDPNCMPKTR